ncbi:MAG: sugar ABC transporter permease [Clostridia bacterium]|nr:sugar ABC transporter permease [Clostridia bacterium]
MGKEQKFKAENLEKNAQTKTENLVENVTEKEVALKNAAAEKEAPAVSTVRKTSAGAYFKKHRATYLFLLPGIICCLIFHYLPLAGLSMAFMKVDILDLFHSPWIGLENFKKIISMPDFTKAIFNTAWLGFLNIIIKFPAPIIFALLLNELKDGIGKRFTQTVSYLPYFISTIAVVGLAVTLFSSDGIVNEIRSYFKPNEEPMYYLLEQKCFVPMNVGLVVWKNLGWSSVIYLATISGIDAALYEAAIIDGAGRFKQCLHITIPSIIGTVIILLILEIGNLFKTNFDIIYGLQNSAIDYEVISTMVYKKGIQGSQYGIATALSLMEGLMSLVLVLATNFISKRLNDTSLI